MNPVDYESIKEDTDFHRIDICDTVELQDLPCKTVEVDVKGLQDLPTKIIDELELSDICLIEKYILDKEEIEFQEMDKFIIELPDKQEIHREVVVLPKIPV